MLLTFDDLPIDGSVIREIAFVPSQSVQFSVLRPPVSDGEAQVSTQYRLRFNQIHSCKFGFDAQPWLEIKSHRIVTGSEFLESYNTSENRRAEFWQQDAEVCHFQLILEEGQIDIIAEQFLSTIEQEMSHLGRSESNAQG